MKKDWSSLSSEELKSCYKELRGQIRVLEKEIATYRNQIRERTIKCSKLGELACRAKELVGRRQGTKCPGMKREYRGNSYYVLRCLARPHAFPSYSLGTFYARRCFYCKMTKKEARIARQYNLILSGQK